MASEVTLYYASWCGPSQKALSEARDKGIETVDIDDHPEVALELNLRATPTWVTRGESGEVLRMDIGKLHTEES